MRKNHTPPPRGKANGWSAGAARRNTEWLQSVDHDQLDGHGYACTFTVYRCPPSPEEWANLRRRFVKRLERMGMIRLHWVTEWQERRVPHLHLAAWFANEGIETEIRRHWLEVMAKYRPAESRQHVAPIYEMGGWSEYVSKHAARSANHYQRNNWARPRGWKSSGRIWGHCDNWETIEPVRVQLSLAAFHRYRRMIRNWRKADAKGNPSRRIQARRMLRNGKDNRRDEYGFPLEPLTPDELRKANAVRGTSEWIPEAVSYAMLKYLMSEYGDDVEIEEDSIISINSRVKVSKVDKAA